MAAHRWRAAVLLLGALGAAGQVRRPQPLPDPAADAVRVEVRITTAARSASVRVGGGLFAVGDGRRLAGPPGLRTAVDDNLLALSSNVEGEQAAGAYRLVLSGAAPGAQVTWALNVQQGHRARVDVLNLNDEARPITVERFEGTAGSFVTTNVDRLRVGGPLPHRPRRVPLVLAHYYPWYERASWSDPYLLDQPLRTYSTEDPADVQRVLQEAKRGGLDGVIISWQGRDTGGGWNHRRAMLALQAAQAAGMTASIQLETLVVNPQRVEGAPLDVATAVQFLSDIVDLYGTHPAYLRVDGRPVVFVYAWGFAAHETWRTVSERVRAGGRDLLILADSLDPAALAVGDGAYTYAANLFAPDIAAFSRRLAVAARSYHLLGAGYGAPRLAVATVSPGYDESRLPDRPRRQQVDRRDGAFYDVQWRAALASGADWIVVTSWNEWPENTHIEPGQRYGQLYLHRTRYWSAFFKGAPRP